MKNNKHRIQNIEYSRQNIEAESPKSPLNIIDGVFSIEAAADDKTKVRRFDIVGYTGGLMRLCCWYYPVVVALDGMTFNSATPVYINHSGDYDMNYILGQTDKVEISKGKVTASGPVMGESDEVKKVLALADKGFNWQASIGARPDKTEFITEGKSVKVNGQSFDGPVNVVWKSTLYEISFVARGADNNTSANIAAGNYFDKEFIMNKAQLIAKILATAGNDLTQEQLEAKSEDELKAMAEKGSAPAAAAGGQPAAGTPAAVVATANGEEVVKQSNLVIAANMRRVAKIQEICGDKHSVIAAEAIEKNWSEDTTSLKVLQASRVQNVQGISAEQRTQMPQIIEAAAVMSNNGMSEDTAVKKYGEKTVEASRKIFRSGLGLKLLLIECAAMAGYKPRNYMLQSSGDIEECLRAAFSTAAISGILSNIANKFLLAGFNSAEQVWRTIARIRPVRDFKTITSYRLTGNLEFEEIGPDGELKHGTLGEESFTNKAKTHGKILSITRQDIINDDMSALTDVPRMLGRGGILKLNSVFWAMFMNNAAFFTTQRKNYKAGADTALGATGLKAANLLFRKQIDSGSKPLGIIPRILLVPPELEVEADLLMTSTRVNTGGAATGERVPDKNTWAGKFQVASSAYLSINEDAIGYSGDGYYLLADPNDLSVIEVVFLNGQETPIVESADADFNQLGIQMRGYFDFGVNLQDYRGGVKMKGKA